MANGKYKNWLTEDGLLQLECWARSGLTDEQIAHNAGISTTTLYAWKNDHPKIAEAIKKGKAPVDFQVENALLKRALGYEYTEHRIKREVLGYKTENGKRVPILGKKSFEEITTKHVPAEVAAQIFWLKNRRPDRWRDKPTQADAELTENDGFLEALNGTAAEDWADEG